MMTDTTRIPRKPPITPIAILWIALVLPTRAQEALYGTWQSVSGPEEWYEFYDNGSDNGGGYVTYSARHKHSPADAGFVFPKDAAHVALAGSPGAPPRIFGYAIHGDQLTLTPADGASAEFQRAKGPKPADGIVGIWRNEGDERTEMFFNGQMYLERSGEGSPTGTPYHFRNESTLRTAVGAVMDYHVAIFGAHLILLQDSVPDCLDRLISKNAMPFYRAWWHQDRANNTRTYLFVRPVNRISEMTYEDIEFAQGRRLAEAGAQFRTPDDAHLAIESGGSPQILPSGVYTYSFPAAGLMVLTSADGRATVYTDMNDWLPDFDNGPFGIQWGLSKPPDVNGRIFKVSAKAAWQDTEIEVYPGDEVAIDATGEIIVTPSPLAFLKSSATPAGLPAFHTVGGTVGSSLAYNLTAHSLIGKVNLNGEPFAVGTHSVIKPRLKQLGHLFLAPNCTSFNHNEGEWAATISVKR